MRISNISAVALILVWLAAASVSVANDGTWIGPDDGRWTTVSNWVDGIIADGAGYTAYFTMSFDASRRVYQYSDRTIGHIELSDGGGYGGEWIITDHTWDRTLTLSDPGGTPTITALTDASFMCPLAGSQGFRKLGDRQIVLQGDNEALSGDIVVEDGSLQFGPGNVLGNDATLIVQAGIGVFVVFQNEDEIFGGLAGAGEVIIFDGILITVGAGNQTTEFSGLLDDSFGSGRLAKAGTGTLTLSGSNEHTGGTTLLDGALSVSAEDNLGDTNGGLIFDGGTLQITGTSFGSTSRTITWNAGGGGFDIANPGHMFTLNQELSGSGDLTKAGPGMLSLFGDNTTFTGNVYVNEGTLHAGVNQSFGLTTDVHVAAGALMVMDATESWGGLSGEGTVDTDGSAIGLGNDGQDMTFDGVISGSGLLAKHGAGTMTLTGNNTHTGGTLVEYGTLALRGDNNAMAGTIHVLSGCSLYAGISDSLSNQTRVDLESGATLVMEDGEYWGSLAGDGHVDLAYSVGVGIDNTDATFGGDLTGAGLLRKVGSGTMTLSGVSDWTGGTSIDDGGLSVSANDNLGDLASALTFDGGSLQVTGTGFGSTSRPITISSVSMVDVVNAGNIVAVDSAMTGSGDLIKLGDGALALRGNNAAGYTGDITVSGGTLAIGISNSLGNANRVTVESGARLIIEADEEWGSLTGGGDVDLGSYYIRVGFDDSDAGLSGTITGAGVFRKAGAGTMTLSGASDYSGGTYVDDGTLIADHDNALGTGNVTVGAATLVVADGAGALAVGGNYTQGSAGTLAAEISGTTPCTEHDQLSVTGAATLAGTLQLAHIDGYGWEAGQEYVILTAAAVSGAFDTVTGPGDFDVIYNADNVTIVPICAPGDLDCDGDVDLDDFNTFADCLSGPDVTPPGGCDAADFDSDSDVDLGDFAGFQQVFTGPQP